MLSFLLLRNGPGGLSRLVGLHMSVLVVLVNLSLCDPNSYDAVIGSLIQS